MMRTKRAISAGTGLAVTLGVVMFAGLAQGRARLDDPPPRAMLDNVTTDCTGVGAGTPKTFPEGATAITVRVADSAGDGSLGCFQIAIFDGTTRLDGIYQVTDDQVAAAVRFIDVPNVAIPNGCRNGKTCTVHLRQLQNVAAGCQAGATALGTGATATYFSCGDFRVRQPPVPDAAPPVVVDAAKPPTPTPDSSSPPAAEVDSGFTPIPVPEGEGGVVRVSGLSPGDAESEGCSVSQLGAQTTVWGGSSAAAVALAGFVLANRRRRR